MSPDLSKSHFPITELFSCDSELSAVDLTAEQLKQFETQGYVGGIRLLDNEQLQALRSGLDGLRGSAQAQNPHWYEYHSNESQDPSKILFHALGAWRIEEAFHDLLWHPAFLKPAAQLLQGSVRFWHDQLFCKPPRQGGVVAWHQDYSYWTRTVPMAHLTCWIGLDDATVENGCVHYIPGSHRWPLLPVTGLSGDMSAIRDVLDDEQIAQFERPQPMELQAGECVFHHPLVVHGSFPNQSDRPRRATVINVVRDGVKSNSSKPLLEGVNAIPPGEMLGGQFFPLLHQH